MAAAICSDGSPLSLLEGEREGVDGAPGGALAMLAMADEFHPAGEEDREGTSLARWSLIPSSRMAAILSSSIAGRGAWSGMHQKSAVPLFRHRQLRAAGRARGGQMPSTAVAGPIRAAALHSGGHTLRV